MIANMNMPGESDLFANTAFQNCNIGADNMNMMGGMDGSGRASNNDLYAPLPHTLGRPSSHSPASLDGTSSAGATTGSLLLPPNKGGGQGDDAQSFPLLLHAIVSDPATDASIHWLPCGTRFVISNKDNFSRDILQRHFGGRGNGAAATKFTSFTRRLKRWRFSRVPSGREMGAYYHEMFKRGEPELARKILYPVTKPGQAAQGAGGGKPGVAKKSSSPKATVPKARRRASTGSMVPRPNLPLSGELDFDELALDISPTPLGKGALGLDEGGILPMPFMEHDIKDWLTDSPLDIHRDEALALGPSPHVTPSMGAEKSPSVVSNSSTFLLPPPAFPNSVMSGGMQQAREQQAFSAMAHQPMLMRPGVSRRHSTTMENLTSMSMMTANNALGGNMPSAPHQLLGMDFGGTGPDVPTSSTADMGSVDLLAGVLSPRRDDATKDPFHLSRDLSFDDLKMIDPFT